MLPAPAAPAPRRDKVVQVPARPGTRAVIQKRLKLPKFQDRRIKRSVVARVLLRYFLTGQLYDLVESHKQAAQSHGQGLTELVPVTLDASLKQRAAKTAATRHEIELAVLMRILFQAFIAGGYDNVVLEHAAEELRRPSRMSKKPTLTSAPPAPKNQPAPPKVYGLVRER